MAAGLPSYLTTVSAAEGRRPELFHTVPPLRPSPSVEDTSKGDVYPPLVTVGAVKGLDQSTGAAHGFFPEPCSGEGGRVGDQCREPSLASYWSSSGR